MRATDRLFRAFVCLSFLHCGLFSPASMAAAAEAPCIQLLQPMATFDPLTYRTESFTSAGIQIVRRLRDDLRRMQRQYVRELLNMDSIFKSDVVARTEKQHVFAYGPPGAAKTQVVDFFLAREAGRIFRLQMHQMLTGDALVGGQNLDVAHTGQYVHNPRGSIIDATVGAIDEIDKATPSALQPILEVTNERRITRGETYPSALETLFVTSNANLPEFLDNFANNNMATTGPAFINRFAIKQLSYNWLTIEDRMVLQDRRNLKKRLEILALSNPEVRNNDIFEKPQGLNFVEMRRAAELLFDVPVETEAVLKEFVEHIRRANITAAKESLAAYNKDKAKIGFAYVPTLDVNTRNDMMFDEIIKASALVDFLLSPLADDTNLETYLQRPITLDSLSIWRAYLLLTTVAPGSAHLDINLDQPDNKAVQVDFGWKIDRAQAATLRDERLLQYLDEEKDRFNSNLQVDLTQYQAVLRKRAEFMERLGVARPPEGQDSFELQLKMLTHQ
jgi:MoxR-like ATPase